MLSQMLNANGKEISIENTLKLGVQNMWVYTFHSQWISNSKWSKWWWLT